MKPIKRSWLSITMLVLAILACTLPTTPVPTSAPLQETSPTNPPTLVPVVPGSTTEATATVQSIQHAAVPGEPPGERTSFATDQDSFITSPEKRAPGGDRFTFGRYERPFNGTAMDVYFLEVDIQEASSYQDATWIYYSITVKGRDSNLALSGKYGVEFDSDIDGRGDWLLLASEPASSEWTTDGVEVWYDSNNDVGGSVSVTADNQNAGNGYDTKIFDRGIGDDPDLAWVRIPSGQPYTIQFAIKLSLLNSNGVYMAGAWAGKDLLDPSLFDLNDHFTQEEAGSSLVEFEFFYPIKAIAEIDNVCRVAVGFFAQGGEPGLCPVATSEDGCPFGESLVCVDTVYGPNCYCSAP
jgi:hypothetical protein